jgi:hypothetical protein
MKLCLCAAIFATIGVVFTPLLSGYEPEGASTDKLGRQYDGRSPNAASERGSKANDSGSRNSVNRNSESSSGPTSREKAVKDLHNLSDGLGKMIERNKSQTKELEARGTLEQHGKQYVDALEHETKELLDAAAHHDEVKAAIAEAKGEMKAAKETDAAAETIDSGAKINQLNAERKQLERAKDTVDRMAKGYERRSEPSGAQGSGKSPPNPSVRDITGGRR